MRQFAVERRKRRGKRNSARYVRPCMSVLVMLFLLIGARSMVRSSDSSRVLEDDRIIIRVVAGDTLWDIARRVSPDSDPRYAVFRIRQANNMDTAMIMPGQTLEIPSALLLE